ncbi:MAG: GWxTD domain-containing protein [Bacteroidetes bacterium]|nr:GWxTD domain-containing protein [Bacteroidota bacterium]
MLKYTLYFLLLIFIYSCKVNKRNYVAKPSKSIKNPDSDLLEVNTIIYHNNDSISTLFVQVVNENLIYRRPDTATAFYADIYIKFMLYPNNQKRICDSNTIHVIDRADEHVQIKNIVNYLKVNAIRGNNYNLIITVTDINKKTNYSNNIAIDKTNLNSKQNFLAFRNNEISFNNSFELGNEAVIKVNDKHSTEANIDCFFKEFGPALPPFSSKAPDENKFKPDSFYTTPIINGEIKLNFNKHGFYHIRTDTKQADGATYYTVNDYFPGVANINEMIDCTRYIMNKAEYESCKNSEDKKNAIDNFWKTIGGSNERAKELLKRYYGRVKEANKYYSSYTQGWKTDRGMVYIIFGEPTNIYKNTKSETWVYGIETSPSSVRYEFYKTNNPYSNSDYVLERSQFYKDHWYLAVDYWRQGNVYVNINGK